MPKINVYLPDDLAAAVRRAGVPVSAICQQALSEAVRAAVAARETAAALRGSDSVPDVLAPQATARLREVLRRAGERAGPEEEVEPEHLLAGLLDAGDNLALRVLQLLEAEVAPPEPAPRTAAGADDTLARLSPAGRRVLAATLDGAADLGHAFLGTEHLLLGLAAEGAVPDPEVTRERVLKAIPAAIGAAKLGSTSAPAPDVAHRLDEIERRLEAAGL